MCSLSHRKSRTLALKDQHKRPAQIFRLSLPFGAFGSKG
jgi:hypothetical protein